MQRDLLLFFNHKLILIWCPAFVSSSVWTDFPFQLTCALCAERTTSLQSSTTRSAWSTMPLGNSYNMNSNLMAAIFPSLRTTKKNMWGKNSETRAFPLFCGCYLNYALDTECKQCTVLSAERAILLYFSQLITVYIFGLHHLCSFFSDFMWTGGLCVGLKPSFWLYRRDSLSSFPSTSSNPLTIKN